MRFEGFDSDLDGKQIFVIEDDKGAIASARSERARTAQHWWTRNNEALTHFRDALAVPGNNKDLGALEYKAHQLRKLAQGRKARTRAPSRRRVSAPGRGSGAAG